MNISRSRVKIIGSSAHENATSEVRCSLNPDVIHLVNGRNHKACTSLEFGVSLRCLNDKQVNFTIFN